MRTTTLCFLVRGQKVLLAMKKRGFGQGKWNGVGGKVEAGESKRAAAVREAREEIGVEIAASKAVPRARLRFFFDGNSAWNQQCHVFVAALWRGEPQESEEMKPEWFDVSALPFETMWIDDPLWLPRVLAGESLEAEFRFSSDGSALVSQKVRAL